MSRSLGIAVLGWLFLLAPAAGCGPSEVAPAVSSSGPLPVEVLRVTPRDAYAVREGFPGRVVARRRSDLGFERGGRLESVAVDEGDRVAAGQALARLEQRQLEARRGELRARLRETTARLELARLTLERRSRLKEQQSISSQRYDEALHEERALASQLAAARASLTGVEVDLELSTLTAPYAGIVTARLVDEGTVIAPGQALLRLIEDGAPEFRVGVPQASASRLEVGGRYSVEISGDRHSARLDALVPSVESDTRTLSAVLVFPDGDPGVEDGRLGRLELETQRESEGFWLPLTALAEGRRGLWSAYAVVPDGNGDGGDGGGNAGFRVERRELILLHAESNRAYLRGTLAAGDRVVASGLHRLVPNQRVRVVRTAAPDA